MPILNGIIPKLLESFSWEKSGLCSDKYRMQMPVTGTTSSIYFYRVLIRSIGYIIADLYKIPCFIFTQSGNYTCMPKYPPTKNIDENNLVILLLDLCPKGNYIGHYKSAELTDDWILPPRQSLIVTPHVKDWEFILGQRLQAYRKLVPAGKFFNPIQFNCILTLNQNSASKRNPIILEADKCF